MTRPILRPVAPSRPLPDLVTRSAPLGLSRLLYPPQWPYTACGKEPGRGNKYG